MGSVADPGTTVLLSSHLLADLERTCDLLVVPDSARVRLTGTVDDLLAAHRVLVGPHRLRASTTAGAHNWVPFQSSGRYWTFPGIETGIFVALALLLVLVALRRVPRIT